MSVPVTRVLLPAEELEARIGYQFKNKALLKRALTHRSFAAEHNERLEFLGDSVLNCVIGHALFLRDRHFTEGVLSRVRSNLVCEKALDEIAERIRDTSLDGATRRCCFPTRRRYGRVPVRRSSD